MHNTTRSQNATLRGKRGTVSKRSTPIEIPTAHSVHHACCLLKSAPKSPLPTFVCRLIFSCTFRVHDHLVDTAMLQQNTCQVTAALTTPKQKACAPDKYVTRNRYYYCYTNLSYPHRLICLAHQNGPSPHMGPHHKNKRGSSRVSIDPTRGSGRKAFTTSRVESGRVRRRCSKCHGFSQAGKGVLSISNTTRCPREKTQPDQRKPLTKAYIFSSHILHRPLWRCVSRPTCTRP